MRLIEESRALYRADLEAWQNSKQKIEAKYGKALEAYATKRESIQKRNSATRTAFETAMAERQSRFEATLAAWTEEKQAFVKQQLAAATSYAERQKNRNAPLDRIKQLYSHKQPEGIAEYCKLLLANPAYPKGFQRKCVVHYNPESMLLVVEYSLPTIAVIPTIAKVLYQPTRDDFKDTPLAQGARNSLYEVCFVDSLFFLPDSLVGALCASLNFPL